MAKKESAVASIKNGDIMANIVVLRSVYGKVGKYFMNPCKNPATGEYPECVKPVDSKGDMILTDKEKNSGNIYIKENAVFTITDGQTFDLNKPRDKATWEAIQYNPMIAPERWAKDQNGNYLIDGTMGWQNKRPRYGTAELYVDRPGLEAANKVRKMSTLRDALNFIYEDERGYDGRVLKARLLGKNMQNFPDADVTEFLLEQARKNPEKIIEIYTGDDISLRLLFIEAKDKNVIIYKNKLYTYGDNIVLGATDDAVLNWMKVPANKANLELIRKDTYPEIYKNE